MLLLILAAKLVCEVALLCLLGRAALALWVGEGRHHNAIYGLFRLATQPFVAAVRPVTPRFVPEHHYPWVAAALLSVAWLALTLSKIRWCLEIGVHHCR